MATHRNTASFGKRQEYVAVAELLRRGYDVYMTLVDDQQIDCIIRFDDDPPRYIDVQIKARSANAKQAGTFAAIEIRRPRKDYFFIFYSESAHTYWIFPSLDVVGKASRNKDGKNKGKFSLVLANVNRAGRAIPRPKWKPYEGRFDLLGEAAKAIVPQTSKATVR